MKKRVLENCLKKQHCIFVRHTRKHDLWRNVINNKLSTIPRHEEIDNGLAAKICKDLEVEPPRKK